MLRRPAAPVVAAAVLSAGATALLALLPGLRFAYREAEVDVGFETAAALVGLLAAYLLLGRFDRRRRLDDLALFCALALFALTNLLFAAVPAVASDPWSAKVSTWAAVFGRLLGALALALAAFVPPTRLHVSRRVRVLALSLPVLAVATTAVIVSLLLPTLPTGIEPELSPEASVRPRLIGHPAILGMQLVGAALFAAAALGFARRAARERDAFVSSLAIASVFASFARVNYFLYPSLYTEWVYTGDAFRLLFYGFVLAAALREISSYWKSAS